MNEDWLPMVGFPNYFVSSFGNVRSIRGPLKPMRIPNGYLTVAPCKNGKNCRRYVHHLVLEAFVGPRPSGTECRHLNGNRQDNKKSNLAWGTRRQNSADKVLHGTANSGTRNGGAKLTEKQVWEILELNSQKKMNQQMIAKMYGVSTGAVLRIVTGKRWSHLTGIVRPRRVSRGRC
jgi:hypothetical protein